MNFTLARLSLCALSSLMCGFIRTPTIKGTPSTTVLSKTIMDELCQGRIGCRMTAVWDASDDAHRIEVVQIQMPNTDGFGACAPFEFWMVSGHKPKTKPTLLAAFCNDGYGASGVGADHIEIAPNSFLHRQSGGSSWRWGNGLTWQLLPLKLRHRTSEGAWVIATHTMHSEFDFLSSAGRMAGHTPRCTESGETESMDGDFTVPGVSRRYALIPRIRADDSFTKTAWKTSDWGDCSARVTVETGYLIYGQPGRAPPEMRILADSEDGLYIEIKDPSFHPGKNSWLSSDHLEIWLTEQSIDWGDRCVSKSVIRPKQYGVRLSDGHVFPAYGTPTETLHVDRSYDVLPKHGAVRLKIRYPKKYVGLTVVYSDTDKGLRQDRLLATSPLRFGRSLTMGQIGGALMPVGQCTLQNGRLRFLPRMAEPHASH